MTIKSISTVVAVALIAIAGCKKKDAASDPAGKTEAAAGGGCATGLTDTGVGACVKLPAGMKPDPSQQPPGGEKGIVYVGDGHTVVKIFTKDNHDPFFDNNVKSLLAGGGFGGKLLDQGKIGDSGAWGTFDMDDGQRKVSASLSKGKTVIVDCWAMHDVNGTDKPPMADIMETCKSITAQ